MFLASISVLSLAISANAAEVKPFSPESFEAAQNSGKPILIDIAASWCPTCKAQAPIISNLTSSDAFKDMVVLQVDFDEQKAVVRSLGAQSQSTLIVFKGRDEVGRSVGDTDPASIKALLSKAIADS